MSLACNGCAVPPAAIATPRWVEVVSHLDPRYGGLSSAVPALGRSLTQGQGGTPIAVELAAFCAASEHVTPPGYDARNLRFWPNGRGAWLHDKLHGSPLRRQLERQIEGAAGVHIHGLWEASTMLAAASARRLGVPYILSAHGMLEPWALGRKRLKKMIYARLVEHANIVHAHCLHALTAAEARQFLAFGARSPIAVIPNAVELPPHAESSLFLDQFPALRGQRIVLYLGRLHAKKGLDLLLQAWTAIAKTVPGAHLVLAGPDCEGTRARLERFVSTEGLGGSVLFAGMLRDDLKWSALRAAEASVLPSWSEGLSMSALEAMGMGLPVIITDACNMPEVREHGAGWQVRPNANELAGALSRLLQHEPDENAVMGQRGAALIQTRYTPRVVATQMTELYLWTAGGRMPEGVNLIFPSSNAGQRAGGRTGETQERSAAAS